MPDLTTPAPELTALQALEGAILPWLTAFVDPKRATKDVLDDLARNGFEIMPLAAAERPAEGDTVAVDGELETVINDMERMVYGSRATGRLGRQVVLSLRNALTASSALDEKE